MFDLKHYFKEAPETEKTIASGYQDSPFAYCTIGNKTLTYQVAFYLMMLSKGISKKDAALMVNGTIPTLTKNAPQESINAIFENAGITKQHVAMTLMAGTLATKKKYATHEGRFTDECEEPDHDTRISSAKEAAKMLDMYSAEKVDMTILGKMNHEDVVEAIHKSNKNEIKPGKYSVVTTNTANHNPQTTQQKEE